VVQVIGTDEANPLGMCLNAENKWGGNNWMSRIIQEFEGLGMRVVCKQ
jgi:hypothetical protein